MPDIIDYSSTNFNNLPFIDIFSGVADHIGYPDLIQTETIGGTWIKSSNLNTIATELNSKLQTLNNGRESISFQTLKTLFKLSTEYLNAIKYSGGSFLYNSSTPYHINAVVLGAVNNVFGLYLSLIEKNVGNPLTDTTKWYKIQTEEYNALVAMIQAEQTEREKIQLSFSGVWTEDHRLLLYPYNTGQPTLTSLPRDGMLYSVYCQYGNQISTASITCNFVGGLQNQTIILPKQTTIPAGELKKEFLLMYSSGRFIIVGGQVNNEEYNKDTSQNGLKIYTKKHYIDYNKTYATEDVFISNTIFTGNRYMYTTQLLFTEYTSILARSAGGSSSHNSDPSLVSAGKPNSDNTGIVPNAFADPSEHRIGVITAYWDGNGGGIGSASTHLHIEGYL